MTDIVERIEQRYADWDKLPHGSAQEHKALMNEAAETIRALRAQVKAPQWEYMLDSTGFLAAFEINERGLQGWELASADWSEPRKNWLLVYKRRIT